MSRLVKVAGMTAAILAMTSAAQADIKVGFIGSMTSDTGLSSLRGAEIAIDEINANGGVLGQSVTLVTAETNENGADGIEAYKYLAEVEQVDFILSGSIDDVSLAWIEAMREYRIPTLDTWASYVGIIDMVQEDPVGMAPYFMNIATDEALATLYIDFGKDVLADQLGWESVYIIAEETPFGEALTGLAAEALAPTAGIEVLGSTTYDVGTLDFGPIFQQALDSGADFMYVVSSVNSNVIASQYAERKVPLGMTGVNVAALGAEFWEDTGGNAGGISTLTPVPSIGFRLDPVSQAFLDTYQAKYDGRPSVPHFNGYNACHGVKQALQAAEEAGGFGLDGWVPAMERQDTKLDLDGEPWLRYGFWGQDEIEPRTGRTFPHNTRFDITEPYDDGSPPMVVIQWYEDGTNAVIYPEKYATGQFTLPSWVPEN